MTLLVPLHAVAPEQFAEFGGKACNLARALAAGLPVPPGLVLPGAVHRRAMAAGGLATAVRLELGRRPLDTLRWEELWDAALRIRSRHLAAPLPPQLTKRLSAELAAAFGENPVAVRSSAADEDGAARSFAGLHDSVMGAAGPDLLPAIRRVWASLWSDRALLYRRELGLDPRRSCMAVLLMELLPAAAAGILFGRSPAEPGRGVIEAVHGQGQGLVDGSVEPDRWFIERASGRILEHQPPGDRRESRLQDQRIVPRAMAPDRDRPPLDRRQVAALWELGAAVEELFGQPMDCEWCLAGGRLLLLQVRPITRRRADPDDRRPWYLGLHPSRATLERLRQTIETRRLPAMERQADRLAATDLASLAPAEVAAELEARHRALDAWEGIYQREYIPMAHGIRLFGEAYNDRMRPADPFAFTRLLAGSELRAVQRNRALAKLAEVARRDPVERAALQRTGAPAPGGCLQEAWREFRRQHGDPAWFAGEGGLAALVLALVDAPEGSAPAATTPEARALAADFLASFSPEEREDAQSLLELGRAAYRLRDDDNIALGRFTAELQRARETAKACLARPALAAADRRRLREALARTPAGDLRKSSATPGPEGHERPRQLVGQPAGPGCAAGPARVVRTPRDLVSFRRGEILVCDAVDPTMTFVAPLAAAIVERRGGMLIHGAIIAREYGLPCVTGVPAATERIRDGQQLTVDGWLGVVILGTAGSNPPPEARP